MFLYRSQVKWHAIFTETHIFKMMNFAVSSVKSTSRAVTRRLRETSSGRSDGKSVLLEICVTWSCASVTAMSVKSCQIKQRLRSERTRATFRVRAYVELSVKAIQGSVRERQSVYKLIFYFLFFFFQISSNAPALPPADRRAERALFVVFRDRGSRWHTDSGQVNGRHLRKWSAGEKRKEKGYRQRRRGTAVRTRFRAAHVRTCRKEGAGSRPCESSGEICVILWTY